MFEDERAGYSPLQPARKGEKLARKQLPFYPLYVDDFDEDEYVLPMTLPEVGLYLLSLNESWKRGYIPDDPQVLAVRIRRDPKHVARAWPAVRARFIESGTVGRLISPRLEHERERAAVKSKQASDAASSRYGRTPPAHADAERTHMRTQQDTRAPASESLSVSKSVLEVKPSNEEKSSTRARDVSVATRCAPELEPVAILEEIREVYRQGGAPFPDSHQHLAVQYLLDIPLERRARVANYVKWAFVSGKWPNPSKTKALLNVLRDGDWDVELSARTLTQQNGKVNRSEESYHNVLKILEGK